MTRVMGRLQQKGTIIGYVQLDKRKHVALLAAAESIFVCMRKRWISEDDNCDSEGRTSNIFGYSIEFYL